MKKFIILICALIMNWGFSATSYAYFFIDFEEGIDRDEQPIDNTAEIAFEPVVSGGYDWVYADSLTGTYNTRSINLNYSYYSGAYQHYGNVCAWLGDGGSAGKIDFINSDGIWFETGYTTHSDIWVEGYDSSDTMIASDSGSSNINEADMGWLRIDAPAGQSFAYVKISGTANQFIMDNMSGDTLAPQDPIPEPATLLLLGSGLFGLAGLSKVKRNKKS